MRRACGVGKSLCCAKLCGGDALGHWRGNEIAVKAGFAEGARCGESSWLCCVKLCGRGAIRWAFLLGNAAISADAAIGEMRRAKPGYTERPVRL